MLQVGFSDDYYDWMVLVIISIDYRDDDIFHCHSGNIQESHYDCEDDNDGDDGEDWCC